MNDSLRDEVRRLLLEEHLSSREVGKRLGLTPSEVMAIKNREDSSKPPKRKGREPERRISEGKSGAAQIEDLREHVRRVLAERFEAFPPAVLLRLWQLIEDRSLLESSGKQDEDPFEIPEHIRRKIFELLDGI